MPVNGAYYGRSVFNWLMRTCVRGITEEYICDYLPLLKIEKYILINGHPVASQTYDNYKLLISRFQRVPSLKYSIREINLPCTRYFANKIT